MALLTNLIENIVETDTGIFGAGNSLCFILYTFSIAGCLLRVPTMLKTFDKHSFVMLLSSLQFRECITEQVDIFNFYSAGISGMLVRWFSMNQFYLTKHDYFISHFILEPLKYSLGHMHDNSSTEIFKEICLNIFEVKFMIANSI